MSASENVDLWFPVYIGDYVSDTLHLTTEQHGAYFLLMMAYWKRGGPLPDNNAILAGICRMSVDAWSMHRAVLEEFFSITQGVHWLHRRIEKELVVAKDNRKKNVSRAKKAAEARWNKQKQSTSNACSNAQEMLEECPSPSPVVSKDTTSSTSENKFSDDDHTLANFMFAEISKPDVAPKSKKPDFDKWADVIRLMRERDGHTLEEITEIFKWANAHHFWKTNILSPLKLREQFAKLDSQRRNESATSNQPGRPSSEVDKVRAATTAAARERENLSVRRGEADDPGNSLARND